jgi:TonB family protein
VNESILHGAVRTIAIAVVLTAARATFAQDALVVARDLYRAAAYDDALVRLDNLRGSAHGSADGRFIEQYRAFCLLALGRTAEAERAIEAVVVAAPSFRPSDADESPRVRSAFSEVRRRVLPGIIQQQYAQAKAAFDRNDSASATTGFQQVLDLLADADVASAVNQPPLAELQTLATGFRDLSARAAPQRAALPALSPTPPRPTAALPAAIRPEPAAQAVPRGIYSAEDPTVAPPVIVRESWATLADVFAVRVGVIAIVIDETGAVETATMLVAVNAVYDRLALTTAKRWRYKPATVAGVPVKFRRVILLDLKATR